MPPDVPLVMRLFLVDSNLGSDDQMQPLYQSTLRPFQLSSAVEMS